jgi:hypothetical protein
MREMRNESTAIALLDTSMLPGRNDLGDSFLHRSRALEVGVISHNRAHEFLRTLHLCWSHCASV